MALSTGKTGDFVVGATRQFSEPVEEYTHNQQERRRETMKDVSRAKLSDIDRERIERIVEVLKRFPDGVPTASVLRIVGFTHKSNEYESILSKIECLHQIWVDEGKIGLFRPEEL